MILFPRFRLLSWYQSSAGRAAVARGAAHARDLNLAIIGTARDCETGLKYLRLQVEKIRRRFRDSFVAVYENGSLDRTKHVLRTWQTEAAKVYLHLNPDADDRFTQSFGLERITRMTRCRNHALRLMHEAAAASGITPDFVLVVDWDMRSLPPEGVLVAPADSSAWDVLTANGLSYRGRGYRRILRGYRYYDAYAVRTFEHASQTQTEAEIFANWEHFSGLQPGQTPIPVFTGYGGAALYRMNRLQGQTYAVCPNADPVVQALCEHTALHLNMRRTGPLQVGIHPALLAFYENPWDVTLGQTLRRWRKKLRT